MNDKSYIMVFNKKSCKSSLVNVLKINLLSLYAHDHRNKNKDMRKCMVLRILESYHFHGVEGLESPLLLMKIMRDK